MNKVGKIVLRNINRISPSQFCSMKNCAYKSLLAESFEKKPLLPVSPNAYVGTVLHKMLELIAKGVIRNEDDFNKAFEEQVKLQEENLKQHNYEFFIPLQKNIKDFGIKKILLKKHLKNLSERPALSSGVKFIAEKWFESKDKLIAGKIDLVIEAGEKVEIIDFKTGAITQDILDDNGEMFAEVKEEYNEQLKLYAYLYFENTNKFPTELSIVDLAKQKFLVSFSMSECKSIFIEAKELLEKTNNSINSGTYPANPKEANCKYCLYRPACSFYLNQLETNLCFRDVSGVVKKIVRYLNGNISLFLENSGRNITVTSFPSEKYDELNDCINQKINIFNLKKENIENTYSAIKTTIIYANNNTV